ncbi:chorismate-binding protein, partial [Vibrio parahaemolyticus]|nr:chorismate-binding protein [Vibrio parahaemolyticus]
ALYQTVFSSAVVTPIDMVLVVAGSYLHKKLNLSVLWMIVFFVSAGLVTGMM